MGQPDLGQTIIFAATWFVLVLVAGLSMRIMAMLGAGGAAGIVLAYFFYPVAQQRINIWLFESGDSYQVDKAHRSEEQPSELPSLMRISYAVVCLNKQTPRLSPHNLA